jgi:hypothetical protein
MSSLRRMCLCAAATLMLLAAPRPTPVLGQTATNGVYTYRYGYNPGYYGSSAYPPDSGTKPGQTTSTGGGRYWYVAPVAAPSRPTAQPFQPYIRIAR